MSWPRQPNWNPSAEETSLSPVDSGVPAVTKALRLAGSWSSTSSLAFSTLADSGRVVVVESTSAA
ncbi:hypothetical protein ACKFRH_00515 [Corynebacterium kefirresidentii]|uniref:hypothetical protein n=1 Tax=Corynebacterium kefirresidentii TaxID=1979527 RepID=UPI0038D1FCF8